MALQDITAFTEGPFGTPGTKRFKVAAGAAASINPGEPVTKALGTSGTSVSAMTTNKPLVGTDYIAGVSQSFSTDTTTATGVVDVYDVFSAGQTFLIAPKVAASWDTQAEYDALVGSRVLLDLTAGAYTILATDNSSNGCVVEPLDITKHPGKVRFSFRKGANYLA